MNYVRMPIEIESPEQMGYDKVRYNLTESSLSDARLRDLMPDLGLEQALRDLVLCYGDHRGKQALRQLIADEASQTSAPHALGPLSPEDVLITTGAAAALFIVATTLLDRGDHLLVVRPNYATNIETPRALGAEISYLDLRFEDGFGLDVDRLAAGLRPRTRLISLTTPHNPTGMVVPPDALNQILALAEARDAYLLIDETYREMAFANVPAPFALHSPRVISVSSLSKTYGLPGIRLGWLLCRDAALQERFLAAKEQIFITNSVVDEEIALRYLQGRAQHLPAIRDHIRSHFQIVRDWMASPDTAALLEWVQPHGGVVCFPRIRDPRITGVDVDAFYRILNDRYGTFVGPGHWFEQDRRHMRIGFGWPTTADLRTGLSHVVSALRDAQVGTRA